LEFGSIIGRLEAYQDGAERMAKVRDRAMAIVELLAAHAGGMLLIDIADTLDIPRSATHRVLADLKLAGYVRQDNEGERYCLTAKLVTLAATFLAGAGVTNLVQPILDRLAEATTELVRLAVISDGNLRWVARSQGSRQGLRYDPSDGTEIRLAVTSVGHAWLACLTDEQALELVARQGFFHEAHGPGAPRTIDELLLSVRNARARGYATVTETNEAGTSALSAAILGAGSREPIGMLNIAGPTVRLGSERMAEIAPMMLAASTDLSLVCSRSPLFRLGGHLPHKMGSPAAA
jgi:DNA-binding IclR family transcriptional regulator